VERAGAVAARPAFYGFNELGHDAEIQTARTRFDNAPA
jgi:hypothetical protein